MALEKALIVTPLYPPDSLGGTQLRARRLAHRLLDLGVEAEVVSVGSIVPGTQDALTGVEDDVYESVPVHRLHLTYTRAPEAFEFGYHHPEIEAYLDGLVTNYCPDLVHLISGYLVTACAIAAARRQGVPAIATITDYWFICPRINLIRSNGRMCPGPVDALDCARCLLSESRRYRLPELAFPAGAGFVWRMLGRSEGLSGRVRLRGQVRRRSDRLVGLLNEADAVVLPTNSLRPRLLRAGVRDRFVLVRHGIVPEELGLPLAEESRSATFRFGFLGNLLYSKGVDIVLDAYRELTNEDANVSLSLWGAESDDCRFAARLQKKASHAPRVEFCGRFVPKQLARILSELDAVVVPSRWPEIGPFVVLEALAARRPVIAARTGNMPELVEHGVNGLLFEPDSVTGLAAQMRRLIEEPGLYQRLCDGIGAVRTVEDEVNELLDVYRQVLS